MIKKLCIFLLSAAMIVPAMAQSECSQALSACGKLKSASFGPKKGQFEISMQLGSGNFFNDLNGLNHLLPQQRFLENGNTIGVGGGTSNGGDNPGMYLNLGSLNSNSLVNMAGIQGAYFITDNINVTLGLGLNIGVTPQRNYEEGMPSNDPLMNIPAYQYITGQITHQWFVNVGGNYYFNTNNERIHPYLGLQAGFQMGRIQTNFPFTGESVVSPNPSTGKNDELEFGLVYGSSNRGMVQGINAAVVAGIEYAFAPGFNIAFELQPASFQNALLTVTPSNFRTYAVMTSSWNAFTRPMLRLSMRF